MPDVKLGFVHRYILRRSVRMRSWTRSVTRDVAEKAGSYNRTTRGHSLELDDCLVAATAFVHRAILATGNGKHYPRKDIEVTVVSTE